MIGIMGKPSTILILLSLVSTLVAAHAFRPPTTFAETTRSFDQWFKTLNRNKQNTATTLTKLQIYIHANFAASKDQTVYIVAKADITSQSPSNFGEVLVIDNPITAGVDPASESLGRYQGMNTYADFHTSAPNMNMNMIFSDGDYNGSTISVMGRQPLSENVRLMSIIGGSGAFRMAKGIVLASTLSVDPVTQIGAYVYVMYLVTPAAAGGVRTA